MTWVFEASWEVCNKVGGIYTVVSSKANQMQLKYKEKYVLIGPYFMKKATGEFVEELPPEAFREAFAELRKEGICCHWGKWLVKGQPYSILIDFAEFTPQLNYFKEKFWDWYQLDSLGTSFYDFDEPFIWGIAVGKLIEKLSLKSTVLHCHEWLAGSALLYIKQTNKKIATVFTTHATALGRAIATSNKELYELLDKIKPEEEAKQMGMQAKYRMEQQSAKQADVFTTVSEITSIEAEKLLGRKPDVILPNGLDFSKFPSIEELTIKHALYKHKIKEFLVYYFFPYYSFDLDNVLVFFLVGRYEYRDKGIDVYIKALAKLNEELKKTNSPKTVIAFFWVPGGVRSIRSDLLESRIMYDDIVQTVDENITDVRVKILHSLVSNEEKVGNGDLFDESTRNILKKKVLKFNKNEGMPALCTHELNDEGNDPIIQGLRQNGLLNRVEDKVKAVYYPIYLTGADGLLDTNYYESMTGSHLGVLPSYYEPWGYTPLEAGALGIASVTTDLAGFGRYMQKIGEHKRGVFVLPRFRKPENVVVDDLAKYLIKYTNFSKEERINDKLEARRIASLCDWKNFVTHYFDAHKKALEKHA